MQQQQQERVGGGSRGSRKQQHRGKKGEGEKQPKSGTSKDVLFGDDDENTPGTHQHQPQSTTQPLRTAADGGVVAQGGGLGYDDCFALLVCSASGTGKSTLIQRLCTTPPLLHKPLFVYCNNKTFDTPNGASEYAAGLLPRAKPITLEDAVRTAHDAIIVVEDLQNFDNHELILLKQLVNWSKRHRRLHVFLATHVVLKSNLVNILDRFDAIVVLQHGSNDGAYRSIAAVWKMERPDTEPKWEELMDAPPFSMLVFTSRAGKRVTLLETRPNPTIAYLTSGENADGGGKRGGKTRRLEKNAIDFVLNSFKNPKGAKALFHFIASSHSDHFDQSDCSIRMKNSGGKVLSCSLFDYISACLGESEPDPPVAALHRALCKKILIPKHLTCDNLLDRCNKVRK
jgi:hypothetical protein